MPAISILARQLLFVLITSFLSRSIKSINAKIHVDLEVDMSFLKVLTSALIITVSPLCFAQRNVSTEQIHSLLSCLGIAQHSARLSCFDNKAQQLQTDLDFLPRDMLTSAAATDKFGLANPPVSVEEFGRQKPSQAIERVNKLEARVVEWRVSLNGRSHVILDNEQVWTQSSGDVTNFADLEGSANISVTIEEGVLGSYNLRVKDRRGFLKVTRLR
jgi:hypothetical protein